MKTAEQAIEDAQKLLGPNSEVIPNQDSTLFLCLLKSQPKMTFAVIDQSSVVILKKQNIRGKVSWHTTTSIKVQEQPGVIQDRYSNPSDYARIIELK